MLDDHSSGKELRWERETFRTSEEASASTLMEEDLGEIPATKLSFGSRGAKGTALANKCSNSSWQTRCRQITRQGWHQSKNVDATQGWNCRAVGQKYVQFWGDVDIWTGICGYEVWALVKLRARTRSVSNFSLLGQRDHGAYEVQEAAQRQSTENRVIGSLEREMTKRWVLPGPPLLD